MITILIPTINEEKNISKTLYKIMNTEKLKRAQIIIVDDGSSDKTLDIINSIKDKRIVIFNLDHKGLIEALNFGISKAKGNYIARIDKIGTVKSAIR